MMTISMAMATIRSDGFLFRNTDGSGWTQSGASVSRALFDRLIMDDLIEEAGDALFGVPSQTWKLKERDNVQTDE